MKFCEGFTFFVKLLCDRVKVFGDTERFYCVSPREATMCLLTRLRPSSSDSSPSVLDWSRLLLAAVSDALADWSQGTRGRIQAQRGRGRAGDPGGQRPLRDQCLSPSLFHTRREREREKSLSGRTRSHCLRLLATASVSQVTGE